jgi:rRNA-processing protein FCF1
VETEASYADDAVVELAEREGTDYVVTNDRPLRDRLLDRGVRVIGLRGRNTLAITQP